MSDFENDQDKLTRDTCDELRKRWPDTNARTRERLAVDYAWKGVAFRKSDGSIGLTFDESPKAEAPAAAPMSPKLQAFDAALRALDGSKPDSGDRELDWAAQQVEARRLADPLAPFVKEVRARKEVKNDAYAEALAEIVRARREVR